MDQARCRTCRPDVVALLLGLKDVLERCRDHGAAGQPSVKENTALVRRVNVWLSGHANGGVHRSGFDTGPATAIAEPELVHRTASAHLGLAALDGGLQPHLQRVRMLRAEPSHTVIDRVAASGSSIFWVKRASMVRIPNVSGSSERGLPQRTGSRTRVRGRLHYLALPLQVTITSGPSPRLLDN